MKKPNVFFYMLAARKKKATIKLLEAQIDAIYNEVNATKLLIALGGSPIFALDELQKFVLKCSTPNLRKLREEQSKTSLRVRKLSEK